MIQMPVDLLGLPVSSEQSPQDPHPPHPQELLRHPGVLGALSLAESGVAPLSPRLRVLADAGPGVDGHRLLDHKTILTGRGRMNE